MTARGEKNGKRKEGEGSGGPKTKGRRGNPWMKFENLVNEISVCVDDHWKIMIFHRLKAASRKYSFVEFTNNFNRFPTCNIEFQTLRLVRSDKVYFIIK